MATEIDLEKGFAVGDNIALSRSGENQKYYKITNKDNLILEDQFAAITTTSNLDYTEISELNPPADELLAIYELRLEKGNVTVKIKQPASTNRFGTNRSPDGGRLNDRFDRIKTNMFVIQDNPPSVRIENDTSVSVTPVLRYIGWRYKLREIEKPVQGVPITPVTVWGIN